MEEARRGRRPQDEILQADLDCLNCNIPAECCTGEKRTCAKKFEAYKRRQAKAQAYAEAKARAKEEKRKQAGGTDNDRSNRLSWLVSR